MKKIILLFVAVLFVTNIDAQTETLEELKALQAEKAAAAAALQAEADAYQARINTFPGWKLGGQGLIGFDVGNNNNWFGIPEAFSEQQKLGFDFDAFANLDQEKIFWRNNLGIALSRLSSKAFSAQDSSTVAVADALNIASLAGYKLTDKIAISAEGTYVSTVLNFNDPGQLTVSAGVTWTPIQDLVVLVHPLGYQVTFPGADFNSAPGAKIGASYQRELVPGVAWTSNLAAFVPYAGGDNMFTPEVDDYSAGDLVNWTWTNGVNFTAWKGIGVGLKLGLRGDKQLADAYTNNTALYQGDLEIGDNPVQMFWKAGLSYGF